MSRQAHSPLQRFTGAAVAAAIGAGFYLAGFIAVLPAWAGVTLEPLDPTGDTGSIRATSKTRDSADESAAAGVVVVRLHVGADGRVDPARVAIESNSTGSSVLADATVAAAKNWTFNAVARSRRKVGGTIVLPVKFSRHGMPDAAGLTYVEDAE
jgi:TonB family protein